MNVRLTRLAEPLRIGPAELPNRVFLAPMSGVTDLPFRRLAHAHGAGLVVSEMIASGELARGRRESRQRLQRIGGAVHAVQLAGREAAALRAAARIAEADGADIIDINMGCPAKKVTGGYAGSALMRDLDHATALIEAVVAAVKIPVTVKMRLGWDEGALNAPVLAARAEQAGVAMITVHGRTRCQFYQGKADWRAIARVKQAVSVPVVANGDLRSAADVAAMLEQSGADAVMVGRASYGAPWLAGEIAAHAGGSGGRPAPRPGGVLADYVVAHYEAMLGHHGREAGLRHARKHLGWYVERYAPDTAPELRGALMRSVDPAQVIDMLRTVLGEAAAQPRRAA